MSGKNVKLELHERIFSEEQMYRFVENAAKTGNLQQTETALPLMVKYHEGQIRDGKEGVPYIHHPLMMACHAFALKLADDDILATILLHDVCEDCGVEPNSLPVGEIVREAVECLTFRMEDDETRAEAKKKYFDRIRRNKLATIVKIIDRCNNISTMANGFSRERMLKYIRETEEYVIPLIDFIEEQYPECLHVAFLLRYQMQSILESLKRTL